MKLMKLLYEDKSFIVQQVCTLYFTEEKIRDIWRKRYGKLFYKCKVIVECSDVIIINKNPGRPKKTIKNIRTGDKYSSVLEAIKETGLSDTSVYNQCNRKYGIGYDYFLKWA